MLTRIFPWIKKIQEPTIKYPAVGINTAGVTDEHIKRLSGNVDFVFTPINIRWDQVEPAPGIYDYSAKSLVKHDEHLDRLAEYDLPAIVTLHSTPEWAKLFPGTTSQVIDLTKANYFFRFVRTIARKYSVKNVIGYQMYNEVNETDGMEGFGRWGVKHAYAFGAMFDFFIDTVKSVRSDLLAGFSFATTLPYPIVEPNQYTRAINFQYNMGAPALKADFLGVHYYAYYPDNISYLEHVPLIGNTFYSSSRKLFLSEFNMLNDDNITEFQLMRETAIKRAGALAVLNGYDAFSPYASNVNWRNAAIMDTLAEESLYYLCKAYEQMR